MATYPAPVDAAFIDPDGPRTGRREDRRAHIMRVTVEVAATIGFRTMIVEDIAATAEIGCRTFYRYFPNKQAAFEAGHLQISEQLRAVAREAVDSAAGPLERAYAGFAALADFLAADPARADAVLVEGPSASPRAIEVCNDTMTYLVELFSELLADLPVRRKVPAIVTEMTVGGVREVAYARAIRGELHELPGMVPSLVQTAMTPYLGRSEAARACGLAAARAAAS